MPSSRDCLVGDPRSCPPPDGLPGDGDDDRVAIVICHGMGQQVSFETLELVAAGLRDFAPPHEGQPPLVTTRRVRLRPHDPKAPDAWKEQVLPRAEITLIDADKRPRDVHLYEAYWAPFTEGKVSSSDVITFLLGAARQGLSLSFFRSFRRWMFDGWRDFGWQPLLPLAFLLTTAIFLALWLIVGTVLLVASGWTLSGAQGAWPTPVLFEQLTGHLLLFEAGALVTFGVLGLSGLYAASGLRRRSANPARAAADAVVWAAGWIALVAGLGITFYSGVAVAASLVGLGHLPTAAIAAPARWIIDNAPAVVWVIAVGAAWFARWFFVQFLGDVAAYVSSHTVSKFHDVREQIREATLCVMRAAYAVDKDTKGAVKYRKIIVVGHSLGSVVAYDVLNTLINEDLLHGSPRRVVERTKLFLTFGSPLDKTAFVFRNQTSRDSEIREAQAAARQPMIVHYKHRPENWINIFSPNDIISGALTYYDPQAHDPIKRILNVEDRDALTPLLAHNQYWKNAAFRGTLYRAATGPWDSPPPAVRQPLQEPASAR